MFTEEPTPYLSAFEKFLLEQQAKTDDPVIGALLAEINRELLARLDPNAVH